VTPQAVDTQAPFVTFVKDGRPHCVTCDFVAGCDGYRGVCRTVIPPSMLKIFERVYPLGWLGLLAETPPISDELIYIHHERGFALCSLRSRDPQPLLPAMPGGGGCGRMARRPLLAELKRRLPEDVAPIWRRGPSIEKSVAPLRSFVAEPLRHGRLFLAGDAAHIVPPTGAKGLNLAASDVHYLSRALIAYYQTGEEAGLTAYSQRALRRIWKAERFSWWMTSLLHNFPDEDGFAQGIRKAELDYLVNSKAAMTALAENYVGLPTSEGYPSYSHRRAPLSSFRSPLFVIPAPPFPSFPRRRESRPPLRATRRRALDRRLPASSERSVGRRGGDDWRKHRR